MLSKKLFKQVLIEKLLRAWSNELGRAGPCPQRTYSLAGKSGVRELQT